jgi:hypothetical protein
MNNEEGRKNGNREGYLFKIQIRERIYALFRTLINYSYKGNSTFAGRDNY